MSEGPYRNHPTVLVQSFFTALFIGAMVYLPMRKQMPPDLVGAAIAPTALIIAFFMIFFIGSWSKRTITIEDSQIVEESNFIFKRRKVVPYDRIASANIVRNVFNRIFGTVNLQITINSSQNAQEPNINFTFGLAIGERIRADIMKRTFDQEYTAAEEVLHESDIVFRGSDAILYGLIGASSWNSVFGLVMFMYSIISLLLDSTGGFLFGMFMLFINTVIPMVSLMLRYYNFKVYRVGDNIRIEHGLIQTYRTSFDVKKINAVRIRRNMFARLFGRCSIEAEVVGISVASKDVTPIICLLISEERLNDAMSRLLPEFVCDIPVSPEPKSGVLAHLSRTTIYSLVFALFACVPILPFFFYIPTDPVPSYRMAVLYIYIASVVAIIIGAYAVSLTAHRINRFGVGEDKFRVVAGAVDRTDTIMQYDRVQMNEVFSSPIARRHGLARCRIYQLSSVGKRIETTGFFKENELEKVSDTVMDRIITGKYDYRRNSV